jgi:hypothetical protein
VTEHGAVSDERVRVDKLKLAAWLRFNHESLISRDPLPNGKIAYFFRSSNSIRKLIQAWEEGQARTAELNRFASIVSSEIRLAHRSKSRSQIVEDNGSPQQVIQ